MASAICGGGDAIAIISSARPLIDTSCGGAVGSCTGGGRAVDSAKARFFLCLTKHMHEPNFPLTHAKPREAPKKYEPAEPTFTITPKKDDASLKATGDFFASISKKGTVKKGDGIPVARGDSSLPDFGRAAPKAAPAASGDFDALASKVQARYE